MKRWEKVEKDCLEYLKKNYPAAFFDRQGASDSTAPDIIAKSTSGASFNIEVKSASAQCGQFVVLDDNGKFVFSDENSSEERIAKPILDHMNENYNKYRSPGRKGIAVDVSADTSIKWIFDYYLAKGTRFFATKFKQKFVILPIDKIKDYFTVKCIYRPKRSGSRNVPKKFAAEVAKIFGAAYHYTGKHFIVERSELEQGTKIPFDDEMLNVSKKEDNGHVITILSKTDNPNVIFGIKSKKAQDPDDLESFKKALK